MAQLPMLVVLIVRDETLRSVLAGRLARAGINLLTADSGDERLFRRRMVRGPTMLVIDEAGIAGNPGQWIEAQWRKGSWRRIAVLTTVAPIPANDEDWLVYVDRDSATSELNALIDRWAKVDEGGAILPMPPFPYAPQPISPE
ncbi:hypothetical protein [Sphingomonas sp. M1-B02]|uniref:hypothetical protein n=1 Tax=Sphingomonas sp. M1-B02 TaxID=3114300 RepID=UPI00223FE5AF|nr:hypothetical protein [Sphingomonas sp. S6-11]UZK67481.1 hypothetical protein OKW87_06520 [Sphingomonas sp. S6-11]